jgi:hypothetical protein
VFYYLKEDNMTQPLTEEQRQKLLQLQQQRSGLNAGVDTTFNPQEPMGQEIDTTIPELEGPSMTPIDQPNMSVGQPEMPQIEAPAPVEPVQAPEPVLPQSDSVALPQPETPADVAPVDPISEQAPQKPAGTSFGQLQQDLTQAFGQQEQAALKLGDIQAREAEAMQPILEQKSKNLSDYTSRVKDIHDKSALELQDDMDRHSGQLEELNKMEYKGFWQNKSTGEKILGALAVALGAYAQGLSGGKLPNTALSIINKAIDDDFKQFKSKVDKKIQLINQSKASIQMKQAFTRDELAKAETYKIAQLGQIEGKLGEMSNKFKSESAKARAEGLMAQLQQAKIAGQSNLQAQLEASHARKAQDALQREKFELMKRNQRLDKMAAKPSIAQKEVDKEYGKEYNEWSASRSKAMTSLKHLEKLKGELLKDPTEGARFDPLIPDVLADRDRLKLRTKIIDAANQTLKEVFGSQISDSERQAQAEGFYKEGLEYGDIAELLQTKIDNLKATIEGKDAKAKYYQQRGSLQGFEMPEVSIEPQTDGMTRYQELLKKRGGL